MRQRWVMGNWKMNGQRASIEPLLERLKADLNETEQSHCVVFPPSIYLPMVETQLGHSAIRWGAQNVYPELAGAHTGELSGPMLRDYGCDFVLVGHSERRHGFGENENFVAKKFHHAKEHDMIPVLCVGETIEERTQELTEAVIRRQILAVTEGGRGAVFKQCVIAYEPVWAIGTGKTATAEQAQSVHEYIRQLISLYEPENAARVPILYGGSVNMSNAAALFSKPDIDGGLVGGASLDARQFVEIVKCIS